MTLEELIGDEDFLEKSKALSDEELNKLCEPFLKVTRPELAALEPKSPKMKQLKEKENKKQQAQMILEKLGIKDIKL